MNEQLKNHVQAIRNRLLKECDSDLLSAHIEEMSDDDLLVFVFDNVYVAKDLEQYLLTEMERSLLT